MRRSFQVAVVASAVVAVVGWGSGVAFAAAPALGTTHGALNKPNHRGDITTTTGGSLAWNANLVERVGLTGFTPGQVVSVTLTIPDQSHKSGSISFNCSQPPSSSSASITSNNVTSVTKYFIANSKGRVRGTMRFPINNLSAHVAGAADPSTCSVALGAGIHDVTLNAFEFGGPFFTAPLGSFCATYDYTPFDAKPSVDRTCP